MNRIQTITPCLWFDDQGEEAAKFYVSVFPNSRIAQLTHYTEAGQEIHQRKPGSVMTVEFELDGQRFTALNGGPIFKFNEAVSLQVNCRTQEDIDHYWLGLSEGGDPEAQQCGWLKDRYGLSWQIVPAEMGEWMKGTALQCTRVIDTMLKMKKLDIAALQEAYDG
jgi:predicted 3-demethylubiquinone-9 3-methyltransferase (glyoxalase superfamily)